MATLTVPIEHPAGHTSTCTKALYYNFFIVIIYSEKLSFAYGSFFESAEISSLDVQVIPHKNTMSLHTTNANYMEPPQTRALSCLLTYMINVVVLMVVSGCG